MPNNPIGPRAILRPDVEPWRGRDFVSGTLVDDRLSPKNLLAGGVIALQRAWPLADEFSRVDTHEPTSAGAAAARAPFGRSSSASAGAVSAPPPTASTSACTARARARSDGAPSKRRHLVVLRTPSGARPGVGPPIL